MRGEQVGLPRAPRGVRLGPRPERVQEARLLLRLLLLLLLLLLQRVLSHDSGGGGGGGRVSVVGGGTAGGGGVSRDRRYGRVHRVNAVRGLSLGSA